uniref:Coatomer subunit gamma n=1 Tax=Mantoniella antarctica TaxID=81844 RepID=A0A7S0SCE9_9CHLO|mmetsp:Transcript_17344/g.42854  ORF Transcript_17344/g.42854 Transcript_17344/m.42854 type:complete len:888 (+) Transcript_17344:55-2718(+)|eukprot:CAMPEP_0181375320 /NCGR_PEP_ID=MMETSP1106-20121128/16575_1 /TAXON_ID=81844 /ORGANISM="Mantoniella antarctica, Strain SL-175" /LENGTH=887 /DNA_ID=CAMNT_0023493529 /DNA_START=35 /DNA_END=2698 /DNA_ORIENTATION=-
MGEGAAPDASKKRDEDDSETEFSPFWGIEKGAVLQEARCFNDSQLDPRRCQQVITKLLYLVNQGDTFTKTEATEVFFSVTKLFQSKDSNLRRMVYLIIKEICPSSDEVIIVTSSLMKDMNSKIDLYRSNAIRVLCNITDSGLLGQIERYLKQAVVDKNAVVSSAALVSGIHLLKINAEIVRRWSNEVQEAVNSKSPVVQFHALALLHQIRQSDRLAVSKLVTQLTRSTIRSPLAQCLVIRYVAQVIWESTANEASGERPFYDFLEGCLRHKSEMVIFEAARVITDLNEVTSRELQPAITVLQLFLSSSKPILRFAAIRSLNKVAMVHPLSVTNCNIDMESLISDQNRSIATLAITTLLKTGNESSVERLMKQITAFMSDIQDEFKIVVVEAIQSLCLKFPQKHRVLMNFLSNILREEGGFEYKKAIVHSILSLIKEIPEAKESGLAHLSEFIEDCEFTYLSSQILHLLGDQGPSTVDPSKYIRYIYNRVILENATIRASAVCALAKFGAQCPSLLSRIVILLRRCLYDNDDEVRDRAAFFVSALEDQATTAGAIDADFSCPLASLESSLRGYVVDPAESAFDIGAVDKSKDIDAVETKATGSAQGKANGKASVLPDKELEESQGMVISLAEFAQYGPIFKSCHAVELTEAETEYKVTCTKHVFKEHVVFQFKCTNTIQEQVLEDVSVVMEAIEGDGLLEELTTIPLSSMPLGQPGSTYVAFVRNEGATAAAKFACVLKFTSKEVDPSSGEPEDDGYADEYTLEDVDVSMLDFIHTTPMPNFRKVWDALPVESERVDDYGLGPRESLEDAVEAVMNILGMQPCEGTEAVPPNARSHTTLLSGVFVGDVTVLIRMSLGIDAASNVAMKLTVRADELAVSELIHQLISEA